MKSRLLAVISVFLFVLSDCESHGAFAPNVPLALGARETSHLKKIQLIFLHGIPASGPASKVKSFRIGAYGSTGPGSLWDLTKQACQAGPQCFDYITGDPASAYVVESYDEAKGTGHLLSTSIVYANQIPATARLTLHSAVNGLQVAFVPQNPAFGVRSRVALAAVAMGDGGYIVGPAPYDRPVALHVTGTMRPSATKVLSAAHPVYLSYDGGFEWATATAKASFIASTNPIAVRPLLTASRGRMHVQAADLALADDGTVWVSSRLDCALAKVQADLKTGVYSMQQKYGCPDAMTTGPDGKVWWVSRKGNHGLLTGFVGSVTSEGALSAYRTPFGPASGLATGSDGRLWTVQEGFGNQIDAMTTAGVFDAAPFRVPHAYNSRIVAGPDGNLWIANNMAGSVGFYVVNTSGDLVQFVRKRGIGFPLLGAGRYLYALIVNPKTHKSVVAEWNARRRLAATFPIGEANPTHFTVDASGALWFNIDDQTFGRISSTGAYCELSVPPNPVYDATFDGLIATPDGYLYYALGNTIGRARIKLHE